MSLSQTVTTHKCAIPHCKVAIAHAKLMCPPHWRSVPPDIKTDVYSAYRAYCREPQAATVRALIAAQQAAVKAVIEPTADVLNPTPSGNDEGTPGATR